MCWCCTANTSTNRLANRLFPTKNKRNSWQACSGAIAGCYHGSSLWGLRKLLTQWTLGTFSCFQGFPTNLLHDLLQGVVPAESALCFRTPSSKGVVSLQTLNGAIKPCLYTFSDRTNQPQLSEKNISTMRTTGRNGPENSTLLRHLPLLMVITFLRGMKLGKLKDLVEMSLSTSFSEESVYFHIEQRDVFQKVFVNEKLRPKHYYIKHCP